MFFSFGVIVWEVYTRKELWPNVKLSYQIQERVRSGERMDLPPGGELNETIVKCWATDAQLRPNFVQVYQAVEQVKESLPPPSKRDKEDYNDFVYPLAIQKANNNNNNGDASPLTRLMGAFDSKSSLNWQTFQTEMVNRLATTNQTAEQLKLCLLDKSKHVPSKQVRRFLEWFSPLLEKNGGYLNGGIAQNGYTIEEIASIVGPKWFVGFMNADTAKGLLSRKPVGSFFVEIFKFTT